MISMMINLQIKRTTQIIHLNANLIHENMDDRKMK